ncbi:kinase-like domain-containing protein [Aspergillus pseudodeflectus]|uniref:Kinase-like domain-containing protein n=1 Tax=Aspergillus pseudodeflectus TaxID=176178 RepID=A0ABR4KBM2_9EURO
MSGHMQYSVTRSLGRASQRGFRRPPSRRFAFVASLLPSAGRSEPRLPDLCMERPDGSQTRIPEDALYKYTRHRWLVDEQNELSKRYLKFNLRGLIDVAVGVCEGARYCTRVIKCSESLSSKAFILRMDNGMQVVAKLPNPGAGAPKYATASEVATHELLRDVFKLPVPRILAWSYDASSNPVGAEYIISEKAPGVRLSTVWQQWPRKSKVKMVEQITDMENTLSSVSFPSHGSVYLKDDLRSLTGNADDISANGVPDEALSRFTIGPLTSAELWEGNRGEMDLDRGPWRNASDYTRAMGWNEIAWIREHALPRLNQYRSSDPHETPANGIALLTQYMNTAAYLVPPPTEGGDDAATSNVLWHPDLKLDNIFVDPRTHQITSIVDWQSAQVAPLFHQSDIPPMFKYSGPVSEGWVLPGRPSDFNSLSAAEKAKIDTDLEAETLHKLYESHVYKRSPRHWSVLSNRNLETLRAPTSLVIKVWETHNLFSLRDSLITLSTQWETLFPESPLPCPIRFTAKELELHRKEKENMQGVGAIMALLRDGGALPADGMTETEDFEMARSANRKFKEVFIRGAEGEEEKELFNRLWPYQETA